MHAPDSKITRGRFAEDEVARYLLTRGYRILGRNVRLGRLELDIVAQKRSTLVICEVRARTHVRWLHPASTITLRKQVHIRTAAARYREETRPAAAYTRFDVAAVTLSADGGVARIDYYQNAF